MTTRERRAGRPTAPRRRGQARPPTPTAAPSRLLRLVASEAVLDAAYAWLCERRTDYSHHDEVWQLRRDWPAVKAHLHARLLAGRYRFAPLTRVYRHDDVLDVWTARDALVLKAIALVLTDALLPRLSSRCVHLAGRGGAKAAVRAVTRALSAHRFVFRTDVRHYDASIDHDRLLSQLQTHLDDPRLLDLLSHYLRRTVYDDGLYHDVRRGISRGCALSPLMGALFLDALDRRMEQTGLFYIRFMDDWVILAPTRWRVRHAVRLVHEVLAERRVETHPEKTFVGRISRGFDFLGYHVTPHVLSMATTTWAACAARANQLYEHGASLRRIGQYVRRWERWARSGGVGPVDLRPAAVVVGGVRRRLAAHSSIERIPGKQPPVRRSFATV